MGHCGNANPSDINRILPLNARKRSAGALCTAFEKGLAFFPFYFPDVARFSRKAFFPKRAVAWGIHTIFGSEIRFPAPKERYSSRGRVFEPHKKPILVRSSAVLGHETEFLTQKWWIEPTTARFRKNSSSGNKTEKMPDISQMLLFVA